MTAVLTSHASEHAAATWSSASSSGYIGPDSDFDVRMRMAGNITFVEFHLVVVLARMLVEDAREICDRIESAVRAKVGHATINIHIAPEQRAKTSRVPVV